MAIPESEPQLAQLAVFDSLLDRLADQASNPETATPQFFDKTIQVVESILDPSWAAVLANGPNDSTVLIRSSSSKNSKGHKGGLSQTSLEKDADPNLIVSKIQGVKGDWGWLVARVESKPPNSTQKEVAAGIGEIVQDFVVSRSQTGSKANGLLDSQLFQFSLNAHKSLQPKETGHQLANDARLLLGCERVVVFSKRQRTPIVLAISSVSKIETRSNLVSSLKKFASHVLRTGAPFFSDQIGARDSGRSGGRFHQTLQSHVELTGLPFVVGVPLTVKRGGNQEQVGVLIAESTKEIDRLRFSENLSAIVPHASFALGNAERHHSIPFRNWLSGFGRVARVGNLSKMAIGFAVLGCALFAANLIQTDFKIRVRGRLQPIIQRDIFAPVDGVITKVLVGHGESVKLGQPIIELRSDDLELDISRTGKEMEQLVELKDSKGILLNQVSSTNADPGLAAKLASEITDIEFQLVSLQEKQTYLIGEKQKLKLQCPIDGEVTTWQAKDNLQNRPVHWGEPILSIAKLDGEWQILFYVPERRIGYLLDRQRELMDENIDGESLQVELFLDSSPEKRFTVPVTQIDQIALEDPELGRVTRVQCPAPLEIVNKRQDATVSGDVTCGRRSLWFVFTREMTDALRRRFVW
jgi:hypothetical protein